jgi:hypothetical protein
MTTKARTVRMSDTAWSVVARASAALGVTDEYVLDELLLHLERQLDESGRPQWWDKPLPGDQKELPLTQSA